MEKFEDMYLTAKNEDRAWVELKSLHTLWFNTGTLCNLECRNCYIESSPINDRLSYLTVEDIRPYLQEIKQNQLETKLIGLTGGEPFLNPYIIDIIESILSAGFELLILTNANRVIKRHQRSLMQIQKEYGDKLHLRISLDHFSKSIHEKERGLDTFDRTLDQLKWLHENHFNISIASRSLTSETQEQSQKGHQQLLEVIGIDLNLEEKLVIFPEMKAQADVPEITTSCWSVLNKSPDDQMCASERMIVKRKGDSYPSVMPCTLLAYNERFVLGKTLKEAKKKVYLNHKFCAQFCVLGGASCSSTK